MPSRRVERVAALLKGEIAKIITQELADPALGFVTVTEVAPAADLRTARVYVSAIGDEKTQTRAMNVLRRARKFIQAETAKRVRLRHTPVLTFYLDKSAKRSIHISQLLARMSEERHADGDDGRSAG